MRIGILTQWYDPEPGPAGTMGVLARELTRRGHEVVVLTGFPNYPSGTLHPGYRQRIRSTEVLNGVTVIRVPLYPSHDRSAVKRLANYVSFGLSGALFGAVSLPKLDVLWVNYSPITVALPMWVIKLRQRIPLVCEVADLWPDTLRVAGLEGIKGLSSAYTMLEKWCNAMYRSSAKVVYISPGAGVVLEGRGVLRDKLRYVPKSANEQIYRPSSRGRRDELGIDAAAVVLLYAGSMGAAQSLGALIDALGLVRDQRLVVLFAGSGTQEPALRMQVEELGLESVHFVGRVSEEQMTELYATADLVFVSLAQHDTSGITMPSKTQATLASGKALLAAAEGDLAELVDSQSLGFTARPQDPTSIAAALKQALHIGRAGLSDIGARAKDFYDGEFSIVRLGERADAIVREVVSPRGTECGHGDELAQDGETPRSTVSSGIYEGDIERLAEIHVRAFPSFFLSQLGPRFLAEFYRGFLNNPTAVTAVARDASGNPVGVAVGTTEPQGFFGSLVRERWPQFATAALRSVVRRPSRALRVARGLFYRGEAPNGTEGALLSSISISTEYQGRGLGGELLQEWMEEARRGGAESAWLLTDAINNLSTNRFYQRNGWRPVGNYVTKQARRMNIYRTDLHVPSSDL